MKKLLLILLLALFIPTLQAKTYTKKQCKQYALQQVIKRGWTFKDYNNLVKLWTKESGWRVKAKNGKCYGIPQRNLKYASSKEIKKFKNSWKYQIKWGLNYIKKRYKNPTNAWKHFKKKHWY